MPSKFLTLSCVSLGLSIIELSQRWYQSRKFIPPVMAKRRIPLNRKQILVVASLLITLSAAATTVRAQQPQIPTLQVCNKTKVSGAASVKINKRADAVSTGTFKVKIDVKCDPATGYPSGSVEIYAISMSDSILQGTISGTSLEQVTTTGKHTPTAYINGRCKSGNFSGYRFWIMLADNKPATSSTGGGTPDVISFLVFDGTGKRVAYGTGPVADGDIDVQDTSL